jgi:hypothetical protein
MIWNIADDAEQYLVYRSTSEMDGFVLIATLDEPFYT